MLSLLLLVICGVLIFIRFLTKSKNYWRKLKVFQIDEVVAQFLSEKRSLAEVYKKIYDQYPEFPYYGIFLGVSHTLFLKDLNDIQSVLQSNFHSFNSRGIIVNPREVLTDNILFINDYNRWRLIKHKISPIFTNLKMKSMFISIEKNIQDFVSNLNYNKGLKENPFKALYALSTSIIAGSVFGMQNVSQNIYNSPLTDMFWNINDASNKSNFIFYISNTFPTLFKILNLKHFNGYNDYFLNIVRKLLADRRSKLDLHYDFIAMALELQKLGIMKDPATGYEIEPTDELFAAQAFLFFLGGVDNISNVLHFTLLELANNKDILKRVHTEIDEVFKLDNKKLNFENIGKLEYLDTVVSEVLRKYPPVSAIQRICTQDTVLPSTNLNVTKGTTIIIPVYALHMDNNYFPSSDLFNPERFNKKNKLKVVKFSYLPFGEGSRRCLGLTFARLIAKFCLASILHEVTLEEKKYEPKAFDQSFFSLRDANAQFQLLPRNRIP